MKMSTTVAIITINNSLAGRLLGVFCASEAQVLKNVIHQMQYRTAETQP